MGGMDRFYQEKKEQEKKNPYGNGMARFYREQRLSSTDTSAVNDAYIDAFYKDWNSFSSSAKNDFSSVGWGNASSSYESRNATWQELSKRADIIEAYYFKNRNNSKNADGYASMIGGLNDIRSGASDILKAFQAEADYYSNFATEDEFNEWNKYSHIPEASDFAEKSKYKSTYRGGEMYNAFSNMYTDTGFDDIMYDYINRDENARQIKAVNDISNNSSFLGFDKSERREMTDEEISIFNYIYATQGKDAAYEYVDHITAGPVGLNARQREKETEAWESYAKESPVASSVFSVFEAPLKGLSYIGQAADYLDDGKIDQNAGYNKFSYVNSAIRNQVTQDVEKNWGGVGSFAYQTGMSMADFLFTTAVSGGNSALSLGIMGTGAAADTVIYAKDRGLSDTQAFALGTIAGAAEIVTEKISLDALLDATQLGKNALGYIAQNIIAEGTEEVTSSAINLIADVLISRDKSEWQEAINAYKAVGMSDNEAFWHAVGDQALSLGLDFLGGAVSGGVMGGGGATLGAINTTAQGFDLKRDGYEAGKLTGEYLKINPDNRYAQKMQGKLDSGKTLSNYQLGKLVQQNESELLSQDKVKIKSAVEARLTELGETGNISKLADIVTKVAAGEQLTSSEKSALKKNQNTWQVLSELYPGNNDSDWTGNIGTNRINAEAYSRNIPVEAAETAVTTEAEQAETAPVTENAPIKENAPTDVISTPDMDVSESAEMTDISEAEHISEPTEMAGEEEHVADVSETSAEATVISEADSGITEESTVSLEEASTKYGAQAQAMVHTYQEGQDVKQYDSAYQMAYDMGKSGVSLSYVMQSKSTAYLTKQQRELAYEAGQAAAGTAAKARHEKNMASATGKTGRKKGAVKGEGVTIEDLKKTFNDTQNRAYKILSTFAEATGVDIVLYKSETNDKGDFEGAQGKYDRKDDKIYIDINAGLTNIKDVNDLAKYAMLRTFSHEFTHFLEKWNPEWYNEFRKVVFETLSSRGEDVVDLIETKQAQTPGMDYDRASREVVAEAMTDILPDSQFIETLANKHKNIFDKLLEKLKEFLADLKEYFKTIGHNPSREANALKEQIGEAVRYVDNIVKMFDEGAAAAVDNYQMTVATDEKTEISENKEKTSHSQEKKEVTEYAKQRTEKEERTEPGRDPKDQGSMESIGFRSRISEAMEEDPSRHPKNRPVQRQHRNENEVDFLFDRENDISPEKNSPLYKAQKILTEEYGMECHVIKANAWKRKNPACACEGKVYVSEDIDEYSLKTLVAHEATHGMKQKYYQPYWDFVDNTPELINFSSIEDTKSLFDIITEHLGYSVFDIDDNLDEGTKNKLIHNYYDEMNAFVYGIQQGGFTNNPEFDLEWVPNAFHDFDAYIKELSDIHEQFKAEIHKEKKEATEYATQRTETEERSEKIHSGGNRKDESTPRRTSTEERDGSGVPGNVGETGRGLQQNRSDERYLHDEVDFLFDPKNYIAPEKNSPLYNAQKTITEEYGIECHVIKATVWKRNNPACASDGVIYVSEDINEDTLATLVPHETTHAMAQKGFKPYLDFIDSTAEWINFSSTIEAIDLFDKISVHCDIDYMGMDERQQIHFYDELNASVYGFQQGGIIGNLDFETDYGWIPGAFHDFEAYIRELSDIHEQYKAEIRAKKSESATVEDENYDVNDTDVQEQSRGYLDGYTNEEYNHFGWARADGILTAQENARLRSLFAETVSGQANPPKTKFGEYMIAIGDGVDNKIAYIKGEIDSPVITHILKINSSNETELDAIRRETYALERRGIQRTAGGIFDVYSAASGRGANHEQRIGIQSEHHNDRFGSERGRSSFEIERIKEILFDKDGKEITRTYAQDEQYQQRTETLTDREILEMAANEIDITDLSEAEQSALTIFQNRLSDLKDLQEERVKQGRLYKDQRFRPKPDRAEAAKTLNRMHTLDGQIKKATAAVLSVEEKEVLQRVLKKSRKVVEAQQREHDRKALVHYRDKRKKTEIRQQIRSTVHRLNTLLKGGKKRNVKEELRETVSTSLDLAELIFSDDIRNEDIARFGADSATESERKLLNEYKTLILRRDGCIKEINDAFERKANEDTLTELAEKIEKGAVTDLSKIAEELRRLEDPEFSKIAKNLGETKETALKAIREKLKDSKDRIFFDISRKLEEIQKQLSLLDEELSDLFERERERLYRTTADQLLDTLANEYRKLKNSDQPYIRAAYDEMIEKRLFALKDSFLDITENESDKKTSVKDMSVSQLEEISDAYRMVTHFIQKADKAFKAENEKGVSDMAEQVMADMKRSKQKRLITKSGKAVDSFKWNNLKPLYAFERFASSVLSKLFGNIRAGEDTWAVDISEAKKFFEEQQSNFHYEKFDFEKKYQFRSSTGKDFELTLGQIMSLYAYSKRGAQAIEHLEFGGFKYDEHTKIKRKNKLGINTAYEINDSQTYMLGNGVLEEIIKVLDDLPNEKSFVDAMQDYLSTVMGDKGNEISLALYGVKLFKEKNYFPLKTAHEFLERAREQASQTAKIKNKGFTKEIKPEAKNPIVLSSFMDVWAGHVNEMSMYHAFALPLEDFYRVYNYQTGASDSELNTKGVIPSIEGVHGKAAIDYIDQLLKDLNGGARSDPRETFAKALTSKFKKAAVMASLSVVVQQPSAIVRAYALVDAKHFVGKKVSKAKQKETWAEVKKYAPVAIIKEMGYFDTGMGQSSADWLKGEKTFMDKVDDILSFLPSKADELTWCAIWNAVKRETAARNPDMATSSEEFLKLAGERFTEVITKTQVYDSTLAKSANMRSKNLYMNMLTAFMAEPTTSINMLQDAFRKGGKKRIARAMRAVYGSVLLNSVLVSLVYAARDDDEDETYLEKYLSRLVTEVVDGVNPLTYLPFVKDIWSIAQGFDVERADMTLIDSLIDSFKQLFTVCSKDTDDMDEEELGDHRKSIGEAILSVVDNGASLLGIPEKNLRREIGGAINFIKTLANESGKMSAGSLGDNIVEDLKDSVPVWGWFPDKSKSDKLYDAIVKGDEKYVDRLKSGYKDQNAVNSAIRKALRDNDPRIKEAAKARYNGDIAEYMKIAKEIIAEGHFKQDDVVAAINSAMSAMNKSEESSEASDKAVSLYKVDDYFKAIMGGDSASAYAVKYDLIETSIANGKDRDEAETKFNSDLTSYIQDEFKKGNITDYKARDMLSYAGKTAEEAAEKVQYWSFLKQYPDYDLTDSQVSDWYSDVKPSGISLSVYYDYTKKSAKATGVDNNGDGKADSGTKKSEILQIIHSLPISSYQKDVLYRLNGWSASTIWEAPWH